MTVRAKFRCNTVQKSPDETSFTVNLSPVISGSIENQQWSKWTPSGQLSMHITNPDAFDQFEQDTEYFIDITPAE